MSSASFVEVQFSFLSFCSSLFCFSLLRVLLFTCSLFSFSLLCSSLFSFSLFCLSLFSFSLFCLLLFSFSLSSFFLSIVFSTGVFTVALAVLVNVELLVSFAVFIPKKKTIRHSVHSHGNNLSYH